MKDSLRLLPATATCRCAACEALSTHLGVRLEVGTGTSVNNRVTSGAGLSNVKKAVSRRLNNRTDTVGEPNGGNFRSWVKLRGC